MEIEKREIINAILRQIAARGISQKELAQKLKRSESWLSHKLSGKREIKITEVIEIAKALGISLIKIIFPEAEAALPQNWLPIPLFSTPLILGPGIFTEEMVPDGELFVPIYISSYDYQIKRFVAFPCRGFSMFPTIYPDSFVVIDRADTIPIENNIYAFLLSDGQITIKRLIKIHPGYLIIDGDNKSEEARREADLKDFPLALKLTEADDPNYPIRGRVILAINKFK